MCLPGGSLQREAGGLCKQHSTSSLFSANVWFSMNKYRIIHKSINVVPIYTVGMGAELDGGR